ncbi:hypothetical protein [Mycobacterium sp.]|uniref:hypothetical protein n=1 Tax=Mycobacterium sp. TaxID=1785 RepID=UPI002DAB3F27|nr:hypothetical protein [Mycobacterium sp.]
MLHTPERWTLRDRGRILVVHQDGAGQVRLEVDGRQVAEKSVGVLNDVTFDLATVDDVEQMVRVSRGLRSRLRRADLVEKAADAVARRPLLTSFVPPEGSKARRRYDFREAHPRLYAGRHVAIEVVVMLIGVLGVGALVSAFARSLLPSINWSWLPDLPDISAPGWLRNLDPFSWVVRLLPDWDWWGWLPDMNLPWLQYVAPVVVAILIAGGEVERRKKRANRERQTNSAKSDDADG